MRIFGRDANQDGAASVLARSPEGVDRLTEQELMSEVRRLSDRNRGKARRDTERELLSLRNAAGVRRLRKPAPAPAPAFAQPDFEALPEAFGLPEITPTRLTPELLRAGILRDGCLLVRGLVPETRALKLAKQIDRSFAERDRHDSGERFHDGFYSEFCPGSGIGEELARPWIKEGGGVLAVDAPMLSFELMEIFESARLPELVRAYLGEPVLVTAQKTTLRKAEPSVPGAWHQDGKFMGEVRALNLWLALSRCGDLAPGLDLVPRRLDEHVTTQTDEAMLDYAVSQKMAEEAAGGKPILRPTFAPGDAIFFDELFLHKTGSDPSMLRPRFAVENWFFGASGFPADYAPIAV